ncbi:hypothetical protein [Saccharopolyspora griseoalba]|uniref:DUF222 domain-containing protein n=1 Tax=Saccharopolyspora griseoalba TaxID=1431848 RepID=A0ABW2LUS1_9PSEU
MNINDWLTLQRSSLEKLPFVEQVDVLTALIAEAPKWLSTERATVIDNMRSAGHSDTAIADMLGTTRQALSDLGDGPATNIDGVWARPRLLRETIELLMPHAADSRDLVAALGVLRRRGRPNSVEIRGAALRISRAARNARIDWESLPPGESSTLRRGIAHATDIAQGKA